MGLAIRPLPRSAVRVAKRATVPSETRLELLAKLLPADVLALYLPALALGRLIDWAHYSMLVTACATTLAPLLLYLDARSAGEHVPSMQYVVRTLTFVAWAFTIGGNPIAAIAAIAVPLIGVVLVRIQQRPW